MQVGSGGQLVLFLCCNQPDLGTSELDFGGVEGRRKTDKPLGFRGLRANAQFNRATIRLWSEKPYAAQLPLPDRE